MTFSLDRVVELVTTHAQAALALIVVLLLLVAYLVYMNPAVLPIGKEGLTIGRRKKNDDDPDISDLVEEINKA
jgi:hypothetical protein